MTSTITVEDKINNENEEQDSLDEDKNDKPDKEIIKEATDKSEGEGTSENYLAYLSVYVPTRESCQGSLERVKDEDIEKVIDDKPLVEGYRACLLAKRGDKRDTCTCVGWNLSRE